MKHIDRYYKRKGSEAEHILYAYRTERNLIICMDSGDTFSCSMMIRELKDYLPENDYLIIRRGVIARKTGILAIDDEGIYTMIDGKTFQGQKRHLIEHKKIRTMLNLDNSRVHVKDIPVHYSIPLNLLEKCSVLDNMPVAYCVIELVFDEAGHGIDFIFRYCNKQMEVIEGVPVEDMVDHSFYEVFKNGDKKWLIAYADVALNGVQRTLHDYSPEVSKTLTIHCYQPEPGYCACVLTEDKNIDICPEE